MATGIIGRHPAALLCTIPLLVWIMGDDCCSKGKVHRATIGASLFAVVLEPVRDRVEHSVPGQAFAAAETHARALFFAHGVTN